MGLLRSGKRGHQVRHLRASRGCEWVVLMWRADDALTEWRVLRSQADFAANANEPRTGSEQVLVYEGPGGELQDQDVIDDVPYYYTLFGREFGGEWLGQAEVKVTPKCEIFYTRENPAQGERLSLSGIGPHLT